MGKVTDYIRGISFTNALAFYIVTLCFGFFFYICSSKFPIGLLKDIGDIKIAMITILTGIIAYFFGSSKSTKARDETINTALTKGLKDSGGQ